MIQASEAIVLAQELGKQVTSPAGMLTILSDVNLRVQQGEALAVLGPSGSGKSTLLGLLAGLDLPSSGDACLFGQRLSELNEDGRARLRAGRVGFVFQSFQLLPGLTALENIMLPMELAGNSMARQAAESLGRQVGLGDRLDHYPVQLSGGEQQRVALARAFAGHPELLFADEPTGNLDSATGKRVADLMFDLRREQGTTLILVTHDAELAARCDRRVHMDSGMLEHAA
jgi:putative ABC transport system ATP-binding protein